MKHQGLQMSQIKQIRAICTHLKLWKFKLFNLAPNGQVLCSDIAVPWLFKTFRFQIYSSIGSLGEKWSYFLQNPCNTWNKGSKRLLYSDIDHLHEKQQLFM